eukprot:GILK01011923.1.p1 GENE.GILK01011923.1~~GILK01011923.1.p1  ORF type:complete len:655 (+),score=117.37 GILK01011923.1:388-2352(+)
METKEQESDTTGSPTVAPRVEGVIFDLGATLQRFKGRSFSQARRHMHEGIHTYLCKRKPSSFSHVREQIFLDAMNDKHRRNRDTQNEGPAKEYTSKHILLETLAEFNISDISSAEVESAVQAGVKELEKHFELFPGAIEMLQKLRQDGYKLALVTNANDVERQERAIDFGNLRQYFDPIFVSGTVGFGKPDPRIFQLVLDKWQMSPGQVVCVGDMIGRDVLCGKRAGIRSIWAAMEPHSADRNSRDILTVKPDMAVSSLLQVPAAIQYLDYKAQNPTSRDTVVGYALPSKKVDKLVRIGCLLSKPGWMYWPVDLDVPLVHQTRFDVILHKLTRDILRAPERRHYRSRLRNLLQYLESHPDTILIERQERVAALLNRLDTHEMLSRVVKQNQTDLRMRMPRVAPFPDKLTSAEDIRGYLAMHSLDFPLIVKPSNGFGKYSTHEMAVVFNLAGLRHIKLMNFPPSLILQEFINHNQTTIKVTCLGQAMAVTTTVSLPDVSPDFLRQAAAQSHTPVLTVFNSEKMLPCAYSPVQFTPSFIKSDTAEEPAAVESNSEPMHGISIHSKAGAKPLSSLGISHESIRELAEAVKAECGLNIIGFDLIVDSSTHELVPIDIDYFPSFGLQEIEDISIVLESFIRKSIESPRRPPQWDVASPP